MTLLVELHKINFDAFGIENYLSTRLVIICIDLRGLCFYVAITLINGVNIKIVNIVDLVQKNLNIIPMHLFPCNLIANFQQII